MRISKIAIRNYRGVAALDVDVPEKGAVVAGKNGAGKTTVLKAIRAALTANDIGEDAIRNGSEKAEILVDLDNISVRRAISRKGSSLTVTKDGFRAPKPQAFLTDLLGTSPLDPLDLFLAKPKERRAQILAALPVRVTLEQLRSWAPGVPASLDVSGHGLEVLDRVRSHFYDERTAANKAAAETKREAERLQAAARRMPDDAPTEDDAKKAHDAAQRWAADVRARQEAATKAAAGSAKARARIADLRQRAADARDEVAPVDAELHEDVRSDCATLEKRIADLQAELVAQRAHLDHLDALSAARTAAMARAADLDAQDAEIEATVADTAATPPTATELHAAEERLEHAAALVAAAASRVQAERDRRAADEAAARAAAAEAEAERLDGIVKKLTNEAPAALLGASDGIPGLALEGDDVVLDGVRLDGLCGAEQLKFAVEIARRANAKSRILVVDGLERLDPHQLRAFVHDATRDGYQLLATRVAGGDVTIEAIETDAAEAAE